MTDKFDNPETLAWVECNHILKMLRTCKGNRSQTARRLGVCLRTVRNKIAEYKALGLIHSDLREVTKISVNGTSCTITRKGNWMHVSDNKCS